MARRLPNLLTEAKAKAEGYTVKRDAKGFTVWAFRDWKRDQGGWRVVAASIKTREEAWVNVLDRLGLLAEEDPKPQRPVYVPAVIVSYDDIGDYGGFDWSNP